MVNKLESSFDDTSRSNGKAEAKELAEKLDDELARPGASRISKFQDIWHILAEQKKETITEAEKILPPPARDTGSPEKNFSKMLNSAVGIDNAKRIERMIDEKGMIEIPPAERADASTLIKSKGFESGKNQPLVLPDGRRFDVFIPRQLRTFVEDGQVRVPSIIALHGVMRTSAWDKYHMKEQTGLNLVAEREGVVVIYPKATTQRSWIAPNLLGWQTPGHESILGALNPKVNDTEEIKMMQDFVRDKIVPIGERSGLIGHSDGGRMAQAFAIDEPGRVAFLAPWASTWMLKDKAPTEAMPARIILNDADRTLPMAGGLGKIASRDHYSIV